MPARSPNLPQLQAELAAAGVATPALGLDADGVHTYDTDGQRADLPPAAAPIVAAHVPVAPADPDADALSGLAALKAQGATASTVAALKANHLAALDLMERWVQARKGRP